MLMCFAYKNLIRVDREGMGDFSVDIVGHSGFVGRQHRLREGKNRSSSEQGFYCSPRGMACLTLLSKPDATHSHCALFQCEKNKRVAGSG